MREGREEKKQKGKKRKGKEEGVVDFALDRGGGGCASPSSRSGGTFGKAVLV